MYMSMVRALVAIVHVLAGATWMGAMVYSHLILHPRARMYFRRDQDFELFITTLSHGARRQMVTALGIIGLSGVGLAVFCCPSPLTTSWAALVVVKAALFLAGVSLFAHVSWRLWPARVLAAADEIPHLQRTFRKAAAMMMTIAGLGMALGVLAHRW